VAPDGDDAAALASNAAVPFGSVQAAVDFASAHPSGPSDVCVAAGPTCDAATIYDAGRGDLRLREGISVIGGYESTTFTRCGGGFGTRLLQTTPEGVGFGADIVSGAELEGLAIQTAPGDTSAGVTVDGARGAVIRDVFIEDATRSEHPAGAAHSYGIDVKNGGDATVADSTIELWSGWSEAIGVRAVGARVNVGEETVIRNFGVGAAYAAWLENAPESRIVGSTLNTAAPSTNGVGVGLMIRGRVRDVQVSENSIRASGGDTTVVAIAIENCEGDSAEVLDNGVAATSATNPGQEGSSFGIRALDDCPALIAGNIVQSGAGNGQGATGIACDGGCDLLANHVRVDSLKTTAGTVNTGTGIDCLGCGEISGNRVSGLATVSTCGNACDFGSIGIAVEGDGTLVDSNNVDGGCSGGPTGGPGSIGIRAEGGVRIQNNIVSGGRECATPLGAALTSGIWIAGGAVDIHSNWIDGGTPSTTICTSAGVRLEGANTAELRNNILRPGGCSAGFNVYEGNPAWSPKLVHANDFEQFSFNQSLYRGIEISDPRTVADLNALRVTDARDNFSASCPLPLSAHAACVDSGTAEGAPDDDMDGQPRVGGLPDVGPDEWGNLPRPCVDNDGLPCGVFRDLSATDGHACGLQTNGLVKCWGLLQLGAGNVPVRSFREISVGLYHGCGIRRDDANLECWGDDTYGQASPPPGSFRSIASGPHFSCGVRTGGALLCWGLDGFGNPLTPPSGAHLLVGPSAGFTQCAIDGNLAIRCFGQFGSNMGFSISPGGYQSVSTGTSIACGRGFNGSATCWNVFTGSMQPTPGGTFRAVSAGYASACGIRGDGTLTCWAEDPVNVLAPPAGSSFHSLAVGRGFGCAVRTDDQVVCWGDNTFGQATPPN
jgi:hypothetical protein